MAQARFGDTVEVYYTVKLDNGKMIDDLGGREALRFTIGEGKLIPAFEQAVIGMSPGESKTARIPADKMCGPHQDRLVFKIDRSKVRPGCQLRIGQRVKARQFDGYALIATVTEIGDAYVTLDANYPLAGKDLTFDILLVGIDPQKEPSLPQMNHSTTG